MSAFAHVYRPLLGKRLGVSSCSLPIITSAGHSLHVPIIGPSLTCSAPRLFSVASSILAEGQSKDIPAAAIPFTSEDEARPAIQSRILGEHETGEEDLRLPRSVQAIYLRPLKRRAKYGVPSCDLQLRSYSVRNVEFFADFALRAAYYLNLPASGPVPLPRIVERWTVPRSNFVHKKSQENFERITLRRLIQIQDGHPETVAIWLAFLRKHAYYGIGMKANIWEHEQLGVGKSMDVGLKNSKSTLDSAWAHFGRKKNVDTSEKVMEMMNSDKFKHVDDGPFVV